MDFPLLFTPLQNLMKPRALSSSLESRDHSCVGQARAVHCPSPLSRSGLGRASGKQNGVYAPPLGPQCMGWPPPTELHSLLNPSKPQHLQKKCKLHVRWHGRCLGHKSHVQINYKVPTRQNLYAMRSQNDGYLQRELLTRNRVRTACGMQVVSSFEMGVGV